MLITLRLALLNEIHSKQADWANRHRVHANEMVMSCKIIVRTSSENILRPPYRGNFSIPQSHFVFGSNFQGQLVGLANHLHNSATVHGEQNRKCQTKGGEHHAIDDGQYFRGGLLQLKVRGTA